MKSWMIVTDCVTCGCDGINLRPRVSWSVHVKIHAWCAVNICINTQSRENDQRMYVTCIQGLSSSRVNRCHVIRLCVLYVRDNIRTPNTCFRHMFYLFRGSCVLYICFIFFIWPPFFVYLFVFFHCLSSSFAPQWGTFPTSFHCCFVPLFLVVLIMIVLAHSSSIAFVSCIFVLF